MSLKVAKHKHKIMKGFHTMEELLNQMGGKPTIANGGIRAPKNVSDVRQARHLVDKIKAYGNGTHDDVKGVKQTKFEGESIITALEKAETNLTNVLQRNEVFLTELGCALINAGIKAGGMNLASKLKHGYDVYLSEAQRNGIKHGIKVWDEYVEAQGQDGARDALNGFGQTAKVTRIRAGIVLEGSQPMVDVSSTQRSTLDEYANHFSPLSQDFQEHCKDIPTLQAVPVEELANAS